MTPAAVSAARTARRARECGNKIMKLQAALGACAALVMMSSAAMAQSASAPAAAIEPPRESAVTTSAVTEPLAPVAAPAESAAAPAAEPLHTAPPQEQQCARWRRPERAGPIGLVLLPIDLFREGLSAVQRGITC